MTRKIAVSLPDQLVADAHEAVSAGRAASVSAYVAEALHEKSGRESLADVVLALIAEFGPPTEEDVAVARGVLYGASGERRGRRRPRRA